MNLEGEHVSSSGSDEEEDASEATSNPESTKCASHVDFTMRLLRPLWATCESSFVVSPLLISMGLAQLALCTAGATRDEVLQRLVAGMSE